MYNPIIFSICSFLMLMVILSWVGYRLVYKPGRFLKQLGRPVIQDQITQVSHESAEPEASTVVTVLQQIRPKIAIPMHVFTQATLDRFLARAGEHYKLRRLAEPRIVLSRAELPAEPEMLILPGR